MLLAWHVDYWDRLGWKDPNASADHTARQRRYKSAREQETMWTPQFVVDNEILANRDASTLPDVVAKAHTKEATVALETTALLRDGKVHVSTRLRVVGDEQLPTDAMLLPVLYRKAVTTEVPRGENKGKTLTEYQVAIAVKKALPAEDATGDEPLVVTFDAPEGVEVADLGVAVLVERPETMRTLQCQAVPVTDALKSVQADGD